MTRKIYDEYIAILKEELIPAMGCTEPIAIAYACALAKETLGCMPQMVDLAISPNIIKNVKSVTVPHTGGQRGIPAAAAVGFLAGNPSKELEVLSDVTDSQIKALPQFIDQMNLSISTCDEGAVFDIRVKVYSDEGKDYAFIRIAGGHTNVVRIEKNGRVILSKDFVEDSGADSKTDRSLLSVEQIVCFANEVDLKDVREVLERQIEYNTAISREGMNGEWGARIGKVLLRSYGDSLHNRAKAAAAAGSDARMNGCELPVIINSGSGNQGMTASLPVITYARAIGSSDELLLRSLVVSNLVTIHLKTGIGKLSAYCGATSAGCGAGAGICYLYGGGANEVAHTIVNAIAINSGMICDGAKASCAAKIASAVEAGLLGWQMQREGMEFYGGEGIVTKGVENTIRNVGQVARIGMAATDKEIIQIMLR